MRVVYVRHGASGWNLITVAARLMARLFEADYVEVPVDAARHRARRYLAALPMPKRGGPVLVIAPEPVDLYAAVDLSHLWSAGSPVAGWVIDSWWEDRIPRIARSAQHFDMLFMTELENVEGWQRATGLPVHWLPQGTNALDYGSGDPERTVDLQRLGRQPAAWDDDAHVAIAARRHGLRYGGRPPFLDEPEEAMHALFAHLSRTRHLLAFSNRHSPSSYTHPTQEYLTGRWTDALAAGAVVAGIPPRCANTDRLWPGALLELKSTDLESGLEAIASANSEWSPRAALINHLGALQHLDWRWRAAEIADILAINSPTLDAELRRLTLRIEEMKGLLAATPDASGSRDRQ